MAFPDTRFTLIQRVVVTGDAASWERFVATYWRATCRFAMQLGNLQMTDAEDVASKVFETLHRKSLLQSWLSAPNARFKTLLCTVIRNVVWNSVRSRDTTAKRSIQPFEQDVDPSAVVPQKELNLFYDVWAEELLTAAVNSLMADYHREGKGDYFRVLHARICEDLPVKDIAADLGLKTTDVDNYFRHARQRLTERLELLVRKDAASYTELADLDDEFTHEWHRLADILKQQGGLEAAVRKAMK
ncbi:RNA polymerase sigma factor [Schlesneria paludicola]|uniref:RNA polymerase sigma factor n=1 Tax=Schlesneria paludicola TaxID=360056 RepID=UPI000299D1E1|nr:hypothetical protein [Schlesneria paludicola]